MHIYAHAYSFIYISPSLPLSPAIHPPLSIKLPNCPPIYFPFLSEHLTVYASIYLCIYQSCCLSPLNSPAYLSDHLPVFSSIYLSLTCLSMYQSIHLPVTYLSVHVSVSLTTCLSIYVSVCLSTVLSFNLCYYLKLLIIESDAVR
jgi:hypothetical protein